MSDQIKTNYIISYDLKGKPLLKIEESDTPDMRRNAYTELKELDSEYKSGLPRTIKAGSDRNTNYTLWYDQAIAESGGRRPDFALAKLYEFARDKSGAFASINVDDTKKEFLFTLPDGSIDAVSEKNVRNGIRRRLK